MSHGNAYRVNGTKHLIQVVNGRRGTEAYLWTDYSDHLIVYLCQENVVNASLRDNGMESQIFCSFFKFQNPILLNIEFHFTIQIYLRGVEAIITT